MPPFRRPHCSAGDKVGQPTQSHVQAAMRPNCDSVPPAGLGVESGQGVVALALRSLRGSAAFRTGMCAAIIFGLPQ